MRCLSPGQLSEAATTGEVPDHISACLACHRQLERERALRDRLQRLPGFPLSPHRRRELAAGLLAAADLAPPRRRPILDLAPHRWPRTSSWRWPAIALAGLAAAIALVLAWPAAPRPRALVAPAPASPESVATPERLVVREPAPPAAPAREVVRFADGTIELDTRATRGVDLQIGSTVVRIDDAKVRVRARQHALVDVEVVIGAAAVLRADRHVIIERGPRWLAEPPPAPPTTSAGVRAFHAAWLALREGRNTDALALFDAATDAAVAEEAAYWAAIAAQRAGLVTARDRLARFLERFPRSPYAAQATALLDAR